jgi:hypothetical protein
MNAIFSSELFSNFRRIVTKSLYIALLPSCLLKGIRKIIDNQSITQLVRYFLLRILLVVLRKSLQSTSEIVDGLLVLFSDDVYSSKFVERFVHWAAGLGIKIVGHGQRELRIFPITNNSDARPYSYQ